MKADCVPPSAIHTRITSAATSGVHLGCRAATNHAGSALVVVAGTENFVADCAEREILQLIAKGVSNSKAARLLSLSKATLRTGVEMSAPAQRFPGAPRRSASYLSRIATFPTV